jgi:hypothetical protein
MGYEAPNAESIGSVPHYARNLTLRPTKQSFHQESRQDRRLAIRIRDPLKVSEFFA